MVLKYFTLRLKDRATSHVKTKTARRQRGESMLTGNFSDAVRQITRFIVYWLLVFVKTDSPFTLSMTSARLSRVREEVVYK